MTPVLPEIMAYYDRGEEAGRLFRGIGPLERARCQQIIQRYLPPVPASVLDVGGGPGFYSGWLARLGYDVHLIEPVPLHLQQAFELSAQQPDHPISQISTGDARALDVPDASADVVLLFGPLYHLVARKDRLRALQEARRVLRPGGVLFAIGITRYASLMVGIMRGWMDDAAYCDMVKLEIEEGLHLTPESWPDLFTTSHFTDADEIAVEIVQSGLVHRETLAVQGPAWMAPDMDTRWADEQQWQALCDLAESLERDPLAIAIGPHIMAVAYRPLE